MWAGSRSAPSANGFSPLPLAEEFPDVAVDWDAERVRYPWGYHGIDAWAWHVHAFVLEGPDTVVMVDTGAGPFGPYRPWEHWNADAWHGESLADVRHVVLTHLHADHAGGIEAAELEPRFPNAAYHLHPADLRFLEEAKIRRMQVIRGIGESGFQFGGLDPARVIGVQVR